MANRTPNTKQEQDDAYSPDPERLRRALREAEQRREAYRDVEKSRTPEDLADIAREAEKNPTYNKNFVNNFSGKNVSKSVGKSFLKRKGPLLFIGGGVGLGGLGLVLLVVPALLFFHLLANMFDTFDPSATALAQVTKTMVLNKLGANDATTGTCSVIKIACRFKTPSNELLKQLKESGITAHDAAGKEIKIDPNKKWPTEKPKYFSVGEGSKTQLIEAKNLKSALQNNTEFRIAFNKIVKKVGVRAFSRFSPAFLKVMDKFKLKLRDTLNVKERATELGKQSLEDILKDELKLKGPAGDAVEGTDKAASLITKNISLRVSKLLTLIGKTGKGSGIVMAMALQCMANQIPGMAKKAMSALQETAMVSAGSPIVTGMSAIKAGDGDPQTASEIGDMWTKKTSDGTSALNSAGVKYALYGDKNVSADPTYDNVTPAAFGDALSSLDIADKILANPVSNAGCAALMNPVSGAAIAAGINVAVAGSSGVTFGASFAVNLVLNVAMTAVIDTFSSSISDLVGSLVAPVLGGIAQPTLDKMNQPGQTFGNVVTSTVGALSGETGAQTFGTALTTDQLAAYSKEKQNQQLATAELDRATLSPFDASSQYTFLGTIVGQLMPYYSSLSSIQGGISVMGSLLPISLDSLFKTSSAGAAGNPVSLYTDACPNPVKEAGSDKTLAADIFCHTAYGMVISDEWDPNTTVSTMENMSGAINPDTGEPVVDDSVLSNVVADSFDFSAVVPKELDVSYADWLSTCTDPENAAQCTGNNDTENTYGLYTAAKTVSAMLDMDPTDSSSDNPTSTSAFDIDLNSSDSLASNTKTLISPQNTAGLFGIISLIYNSFHTDKPVTTSLISNTASLAYPLTRFTLWR